MVLNSREPCSATQVLPNGAIQCGDPADGGYTIVPEGSIHATADDADGTK